MKNNSDYKNELFVPFIFFDKQPCHKINYDTHYQNDNMLRMTERTDNVKAKTACKQNRVFEFVRRDIIANEKYG